jgi:hypothetical protein
MRKTTEEGGEGVFEGPVFDVDGMDGPGGGVDKEEDEEGEGVAGVEEEVHHVGILTFKKKRQPRRHRGTEMDTEESKEKSRDR